MQRRECYFSGQVQGVGFRYTVQNLALRYEVTGFVRNLPDGRVELVVEGPPEHLDQLLQDIAQRMGEFIQDTKVHTAPATGQFQGFCIRH
jgi:acylphosphatase